MPSISSSARSPGRRHPRGLDEWRRAYTGDLPGFAAEYHISPGMALAGIEDGSFTLGGRSLPKGVVAVTLALTVLGTAHILGIFEMSWSMGAAAVWFGLAHVILLVVVCLATGLWVRRLGAAASGSSSRR